MFVCLLNVNRNSDVGAIAPTGWEANGEECEEVNANLSELKKVPRFVHSNSHSKLRKVEGTMNFESNEFSIPDLTESEIAAFLPMKAKCKP